MPPIAEAIRSRTADEGSGTRYAAAPRAAAATIFTAITLSLAPSPNSWSRTRSILSPTPTSRRFSARTGAWATSQVEKPTLVVLTRVRHCLTITSLAAGRRLLLAEETDALAFDSTGAFDARGADAAKLIESPAAHETGDVAKARQITASLGRLDELRAAIDKRALDRAKVLEADHMRIRSVSKAAEPSMSRRTLPSTSSASTP